MRLCIATAVSLILLFAADSLAQQQATIREPRSQAERLQIQYEFDFSVTNARDALTHENIVEAQDEYEKALAAANENPGLFDEAERTNFASRLAEVSLLMLEKIL